MSSYRPFPKLPADLLDGGKPLEQYADELGSLPGTWDQLPPEDLKKLLTHHVLLMGISRDLARVGPLQDLYAVALRRLSADDRIAVLLEVSDFCDSSCRRGRFINSAFFVPFLLEDEDAQVVSTAALNAASLLGANPKDTLAGRREAFQIAAGVADDARRGMILGGLVALGDSVTMTLLEGSWKLLSTAGQEQLLKLIYALPFAGVAEFMLAWAEEAVALGREREMAAVLGALITFARVRRRGGEHLYAGWPVRQIRRNLPAWAYQEDGVVVVEQTWTIAEFAKHIEPRLRAIAACEREEPKVTQKVLQEWGLEGVHDSSNQNQD